MSTSEEVLEYVHNLRTLLLDNEARYALIVERQVQFALLPKLKGVRAQLEPPLFELLLLCLDGPHGAACGCDAGLWEKACAAVAARQNLGATGPARFPRAAAAVKDTLATLREFGILPKPTLAGTAPTAKGNTP